MSFPEGKQVERKQMEQRPIEAARPLDPPAPDVARAYLDEAEAVAQRREDLIDRHAIALVSLVESIVLAGFLTMMMFGFGTPSASSSFIVLVAMAVLWMQLTAELRESHGVQPRLQIQHGRTRIVFIAVVVCAVAIGVALQLGGVGIPLALRFAPGVLAIAVLGTLALRDLRRAGPRRSAPSRGPLSTSVRFVTAAIALLIGAVIWLTAAADTLVVSAVAMISMFALLAWWTALQVSARLPALGASWRWPHWGTFLTGWGVLAAFVLLRAHAHSIPAPVAAAASIAFTAVFLATLFVDGRDAG